MGHSDSPGVIAVNLKRLRGDLSQRDLATRTNGVVTQADVSRIESGETEPGAYKLKALADALGVSITAFWEGGSPAGAESASLKDFLESEWGADVKDPEEIQELRRAVWPWGPPTIKAWYHALEAMRAAKRS